MKKTSDIEKIVYKIKCYEKLGFIKYNIRYLWISYKVNEDRYWYNQSKIFGLRHSCHHTKNDLEKSIEIIKNIEERIKSFGIEFKVIENNISLMTSSLKRYKRKQIKPFLLDIGDEK